MLKTIEVSDIVIMHDELGTRREYIVYKITWKFLYCYGFDHVREMSDHIEIEHSDAKEARTPSTAEVFNHADERVQALIAPEMVRAKKDAREKKQQWEQLTKQKEELEKKIREAWNAVDLAHCLAIDAENEEQSKLGIE